jgi:hypothetical protein
LDECGDDRPDGKLKLHAQRQLAEHSSKVPDGISGSPLDALEVEMDAWVHDI